MIKELISIFLVTGLLAFGDTTELLPEEYWPQKVTITQDCVNMAKGSSANIKAGTTYVLTRVEPPCIYLSGRINAVKVKLSDTDFFEQTTKLHSAKSKSNRGINNSLLAGKLRRFEKNQFNPIHIEDSDKYEQFIFLYLASETEHVSTIVFELKRLHEDVITHDSSKVMVMFNYEPTPPAMFDFFEKYEMPWACMVFHMSDGYKEAFQHEVATPALVITNKSGKILGRWSLKNLDKDAILKTISEVRNSIVELDKSVE